MWNQVEQALNQSAANVLTGIARLLPGTIALFVSVLLGVVVGVGLASLLKRALHSMEFDRRLNGWGVADFVTWSDDHSPTTVLAGIVMWATVFLGFLVGLAAFDPTLTSQVAFRLFGSALDLLTAVAIFGIGLVVARFLSRSVLISLVNMNVRQASLLSLGVKWLVLILTSAMALQHIGVGGRIVELAFGILFAGIVFTLGALVVSRSKDLADWSLSRPGEKSTDDSEPPPFTHL
jgi:hypothetical protein